MTNGSLMRVKRIAECSPCPPPPSGSAHACDCTIKCILRSLFLYMLSAPILKSTIVKNDLILCVCAVSDIELRPFPVSRSGKICIFNLTRFQLQAGKPLHNAVAFGRS